MHLRFPHALILSAGVSIAIGMISIDLLAQQSPPPSDPPAIPPPTSPATTPPVVPPAQKASDAKTEGKGESDADDIIDENDESDAPPPPRRWLPDPLPPGIEYIEGQDGQIIFDPQDPRGPRGPRNPRGPGRGGPAGERARPGAATDGSSSWTDETAPPDSLTASDFPPFADVSKDFEKVVSTADDSESLYTLYRHPRDGRLLAELPRDYPRKLIMIAPTVAGGNQDAGVMGGTIYAYWQRIDKNLVLIEPNFLVRSSGDTESKTSIKSLYTDRVILDTPVVSVGPDGGPVIELKSMLVNQYPKFFAIGGYGARVGQADVRLATLEKAKAFPENLEITYRVPGPGGRLTDLHYSLRSLPADPTFKPRKADSRVGYFNVYYNELGKANNDEPVTRYINRWNIQKADPSLRMSPPKQPLVWYIEHTTPVRYRTYVRNGILSWNKAFEACGIVNALEVYQQDAATGAHMDKDPEDARYNFFRWNTSEQAYAIGPSRGDPRTGRLIDADVVWHAGLTEAIMGMLKNLSGEVATLNFTPETLVWLDENPQWDPRVRLASPEQRMTMLSQRRSNNAPAVQRPVADPESIEPDQPTRRGVTSHWTNGAHCKIGQYLAMNIALVSAAFDAGLLQAAENSATLDGLPEEFLGAMIQYVSAHEVGHCLGLQHNFSASTIRSLQQINSNEYDGGAFVASVMEYAAPNIRADEKDGDRQGPYATPDLGPYDIWAIQYGYGPEEELPKVLARVNEPDLIFHNDMSLSSPDPRVMVWDMGADSLAFCDSRMRLVRELRSRLVADLVKDGQPWRKARDRFNGLLNTHVQMLSIASRWIGSSYINRNFKGDPDGKPFIENVPAERQRAALKFMIDNAFNDEAFGLTPELIANLGVQYFPDQPGAMAMDGDASLELHDLVSGVQAAAMTMVMNPTTLRRLYDNEFRTNGDADAITLAEVLATLTTAVWTEVDRGTGSGSFTANKPMISSFRRNLQREHIERLISLTMVRDASGPAVRTISALSSQTLRDLEAKITKLIDGSSSRLDPYTLSHLADCQARIKRALEAQYVITR